MKMNNRQQLFEMVSGLEQFVLVTVIEISGSAPREVGARMVVTADSESGSIGGGNLEYQAIDSARSLLSERFEFVRRTEYSGLGVTLKQCCGGAVQLMFEKFCGDGAQRLIYALANDDSRRPKFLISCVSDDRQAVIISRKKDLPQLPASVWDAAQALVVQGGQASELITDGATSWFVSHLNPVPSKLVLFGAGHVGKALVKVLEDLPFQIDWVDSRPELFPAQLPDNTQSLSPDNPFKLIDEQPDDVLFVIMTHDHGLDYELCRSILCRRNFGWLGLIGSKTKRQRFEQRLIKDGIDAFTLKRLNCPIGVAGIRGKFPAVIALATAAQLLEVHNNRTCHLQQKPVTQVEAQS